ncbi:hypothetical protein [Izhakiella australiensis]|nr:hypothetical protein [Izhakiella australiensis]
MAWRTAIPGREPAEISRAFSSPASFFIALSKKIKAGLRRIEYRQPGFAF